MHFSCLVGVCILGAMGHDYFDWKGDGRDYFDCKFV